MKYLAFLALTSAAEFCDDTAYCCKTPDDCDVAALTTEWEGDDAGAGQPVGSKPHANMGCGMATIGGKDDDGNATVVANEMICLTEMMCAGGKWGGKWGDEETVEVTAGACEEGEEADDSESETEIEDDDETEEDEGAGEGDEEGEEGDEEEVDGCADIEDADEKALCVKWDGEDCEAEALTDEEKTECTDNQASGAKALAAGAMALIAVAAIM